MKIYFMPVPDADRKRFLADQENYEVNMPSPSPVSMAMYEKRMHKIRKKAAAFLINAVDTYNGPNQEKLTFQMLSTIRKGDTSLFSCADIWLELKRNSQWVDYGADDLLEIIYDGKCEIGSTIMDVTGEGMRGWRVSMKYTANHDHNSSWVDYTVYDYIRGLDKPSDVPNWGMRVHSDGDVTMREYNRHRTCMQNMTSAELSGYIQLLKELHDHAANTVPYTESNFKDLGLRISVGD